MRIWGLVVVCVFAAGCQRQAKIAVAPRSNLEPVVPMTREFAVPVLMYHRICDLTPRERQSPLMRDLTVSPKDFEEQIRFLKENGFVFLHATDVAAALERGTPLPKKAVALTMDDGYRDNFTDALPILKQYGVKATVFMVTNNFDRPDRLCWSDVFEMNRHRVAFESHTVSHPDLRVVSDAQLRDELVRSKQILEGGLGKPVTSLAYPAGAFDKRVVLAAEQAGYFSAWKKGGGPVRPGDAADPFLLPRIRVHGRTDLEKFRARVMSGVYVIEEEERER